MVYDKALTGTDDSICLIHIFLSFFFVCLVMVQDNAMCFGCKIKMVITTEQTEK